MEVAGLWRYPVKSMQGEALESLELTPGGIKGDRRFGLLDLESGTIISAKRDGRLLQAQAMLLGVELAIRLPTGETVLGAGAGVDRALTAWLEKRVTLVEARVETKATYQIQTDFEDDDSDSMEWQGPPGSFVDSSPAHLLTTASLRAVTAERANLQWAVARFRPNILIAVDGTNCVEQGWIGASAEIGSAQLRIQKACSRCVMTTRPQPGGIERQLDILRHINELHSGDLGVLAQVMSSGRVSLGDSLVLSA